MDNDPKKPVFRPPDDVLPPRKARNVIAVLIVIALAAAGLRVAGCAPEPVTTQQGSYR